MSADELEEVWDWRVHVDLLTVLTAGLKRKAEQWLLEQQQIVEQLTGCCRDMREVVETIWNKLHPEHNSTQEGDDANGKTTGRISDSSQHSEDNNPACKVFQQRGEHSDETSVHQCNNETGNDGHDSANGQQGVEHSVETLVYQCNNETGNDRHDSEHGQQRGKHSDEASLHQCNNETGNDGHDSEHGQQREESSSETSVHLCNESGKDRHDSEHGKSTFYDFKDNDTQTCDRDFIQLSLKPSGIPTELDKCIQHFHHKVSGLVADERRCHENQIQQLKTEMEEIRCKCEIMIENKTQQLQELEERFNDLNEINKQLQMRFNKQAAAIMKQGNFDAADLSDVFRATNIADMYQTIYTTQWAKVFKNQRKTTDNKQIIQNLLDTLQAVFHHCEDVAKKQEDRLKIIFKCPVLKLGDEKLVNPPEISGSQLETLLDLRKQIAISAITDISESCPKLNSEDCEQGVAENPTVSKVKKDFFQKCVEVCWPMVLHNPPLYMETDVNPGDPIDEEVFKQRTAGEYIDMLAWPPLFLGKGGDLLAQGIVQARESKQQHTAV